MARQFILVMVKPMWNNRGFTLIETLFVLMIICLLSTLSMSFHQPVKKDESVIQEISNFFLEAKLEAMVHKMTVKVEVDEKRIIYSSMDSHKTYELEDDCSFEYHQFSFNEFGHIKGAKTLNYHHKSNTYHFVFQVGSGYFYVE